jgi:hypothetical protein
VGSTEPISADLSETLHVMVLVCAILYIVFKRRRWM